MTTKKNSKKSKNFQVRGSKHEVVSPAATAELKVKHPQMQSAFERESEFSNADKDKTHPAFSTGNSPHGHFPGNGKGKLAWETPVECGQIGLWFTKYTFHNIFDRNTFFEKFVKFFETFS